MDIKDNLNKTNRAGAVTVAESEVDMRYKSFENFGVNVYERTYLLFKMVLL